MAGQNDRSRAEYTLDRRFQQRDSTVARLALFLNGNLDSMEVQAHREFDGAYWTETLQIKPQMMVRQI